MMFIIKFLLQINYQKYVIWTLKYFLVDISNFMNSRCPAEHPSLVCGSIGSAIIKETCPARPILLVLHIWWESVRDHSENIGGGGGFWEGHPHFAIYWRGVPTFGQSSEWGGGAPTFCQILIIKNTEIAQIRPYRTHIGVFRVFKK